MEGFREEFIFNLYFPETCSGRASLVNAASSSPGGMSLKYKQREAPRGRVIGQFYAQSSLILFHKLKKMNITLHILVFSPTIISLAQRVSAEFRSITKGITQTVTMSHLRLLIG